MTVRSALTAGSPREGFGQLFVRLQPHLQELNRFLRSQLGSFEPEIRGLVEYCLDVSGKRIRPALVFFSGWRGPEQVTPELVRAAAIVEMVHLATLVHDDIMDGAELRRNRPTAARRYGSDAAVLLGDALLAHAVGLAARFPSTAICQVVSDATRQVCAGEIVQTLRKGDTAITLADYRRIIELKTAELFHLSCLLGSRLAGFADDYVEAAAAFGRHLGVAYQMYDDLADFFGEEKRLGKTLGTDLAGGKVTLPMLLLLQRLPATERADLLDEIQAGLAPQLERRRAQMKAHGVFAGVVEGVQVELEAGAAALAPWSHLEPALLLGQLIGLLREQINGLKPDTHS
jgi:octaprenyl-diphosphate synthase